MPNVIKRDGSIEEFNRVKLLRSIKNSGSSDEVAEKVTTLIENTLEDGETTRDIYRRAFDELEKLESGTALRYSLKKAIFALGPTGFPFEKYVAEIFKRKGYKVQTNINLQGRCAMHEIDVFMEKGERVAVEAKFHARATSRTDLKTVLYVSARFTDLTKTKGLISGRSPADKGILVTNTKFTKNAIQFAECSDVSLLGWSYPKKDNLRDLINETKTHPITSLPSIPKSMLKIFFERGIITCKSLLENQELITKYSIPEHKVKELIKEAKLICS